jgi:hypothetical protein
MAEATNCRIHAVLDRKWPNIALFAYNQFLEHGRGIVVLQHFDAYGQSDTTMKCVVYPKAPTDAKTASLLESYDPDSEVLLHHLDEQGRFHTSRVQAATDACRPETLWFRYCFLRRPPLTPEEIQTSTFSDDQPALSHAYQ